jgi:hypothetical protein
MSIGSARSSCTPFAARPVSPACGGTHERPQSTTNDINIRQDPLSELNLRLERGHIPKRGRRNNKTTHVLSKATQRRLDKIHFTLPRYNQIVDWGHLKNRPIIPIFNKIKNCNIIYYAINFRLTLNKIATVLGHFKLETLSFA